MVMVIVIVFVIVILIVIVIVIFKPSSHMSVTIAECRRSSPIEFAIVRDGQFSFFADGRQRLAMKPSHFP